MAMKGHETLIAAAKFDTGITAEALAVQIIKAEKAKAKAGQFLADRAADADEMVTLQTLVPMKATIWLQQKTKTRKKFVNLVANAFRGQKTEI